MSWAGQLGEDRAITIRTFVTHPIPPVLKPLGLFSGVIPHLTDPELSYKLQLKGSGRTPFSRSAVGIAVLRSSIREYLF